MGNILNLNKNIKKIIKNENNNNKNQIKNEQWYDANTGDIIQIDKLIMQFRYDNNMLMCTDEKVYWIYIFKTWFNMQIWIGYVWE